MSTTLRESAAAKPIHSWLRAIHLAFVPGEMTPMLENMAQNLLDRYRHHGHFVQETPDQETDLILTSAIFGQPLNWRDSLLFTARRRYGLEQAPTIITLVHITPEELEKHLTHFGGALAKDPPDPKDFEFPGLAPTAYLIFAEQGQRGGPILALERLLQAQCKSFRLLLVVGDDRPEYAYHFDMVGAHPMSEGGDTDRFYDDIVLRIVTALSTREVTKHKVLEGRISREQWDEADTVTRMQEAAVKFDERGFFTDMVKVSDFVKVPAVGEAVADQYSEGCYGTWEPKLGALIATVTGSARPVDKGNITEEDLAVIVGVQPDGSGAVVRHVENKDNHPPSSEAVELIDMDSLLPKVTLPPSWGAKGEVPVVRSKLHGHRGIRSYNPETVEYAPLGPPYFHYLVSCATEAQAHAVKDAFARSEALQNPADPRQVVFTVLPGHGIVIAEKWVNGKVPFQLIWEAMDAGDLVVENHIPQGLLGYVEGAEGEMVLEEGA